MPRDRQRNWNPHISGQVSDLASGGKLEHQLKLRPIS